MTNLLTNSNFNLITQVAWRVLNLLIEKKAMLQPAGTVFFVWQRADRIIVAFDADTIDAKRVNEEFAHLLSTRLHGRRVVFTNSRGVFLQVGFVIPAAPKQLEAKSLELSAQPSPYHVPMGLTKNGPLWISLIDGDSFLIGGSRGNGKTGLEHGWIQSLLHGNKTKVYAWDGKRGVEFGRYVGHSNFHLMFSVEELENLRLELSSRESLLGWSGHPNIISHNQAGLEFIPPIALFVDEAADLPDQAKELLKQMIRLYRYTGLYPIIATNQPTQAEVFAKTNLSTRIAFRVPHHTDSITMLGYKGAEALPDVRGRGLINWRGRFIEFQSFDVPYSQPTEEARLLIAERLTPKKTNEPVLSELERLAESIRDQWKPDMSGSAVAALLGKRYAGSWHAKVNQIIEYLSSSTSTEPPGLAAETPV